MRNDKIVYVAELDADVDDVVAVHYLHGLDLLDYVVLNQVQVEDVGKQPRPSAVSAVKDGGFSAYIIKTPTMWASFLWRLSSWTKFAIIVSDKINANVHFI